MTDYLYTTKTAYKRDSKGRWRIWYAKVEEVGDGIFGFSTFTGIETMNIRKNRAKIGKPKNIGKSNETCSLEQSVLEAQAALDKKLKEGWSLDKSTVPKIVKPMLASKYIGGLEEVKLCSRKLDGFRLIASKDKLYSRTGREFGPAVGALRAWLEPFFKVNPNLVLDGEAIAPGGFHAASGLLRKTTLTEEEQVLADQTVYHVYDLLDHNNPKAPYMMRLMMLRDIVAGFPDKAPIRLVDSELAPVGETLEKYISEGEEGLMVRNPEGVYEQKRSKHLQKLKKFHDEEFEVVSLECGQADWSDAIKKATVKLRDGTLCGCGIRGTYEEMKELKAKIEVGECPTLATVRYFEKTPDGLLRFPVVTALYWGERDM